MTSTLLRCPNGESVRTRTGRRFAVVDQRPAASVEYRTDDVERAKRYRRSNPCHLVVFDAQTGEVIR